MSIEFITGRRRVGMRLLVYGPPKVGKTMFAADAEAPIFLSGEDGDTELDIKRFPFDKKTERTHPNSWDEVLKALGEIAKHGGGKTLVIDGLTTLEQLCASYVCERQSPKWKSLQDPGYGKGEGALLAEMRVFLKLVEELWTTKGMAIILIAHAKVGKVKNPLGDEYTRHEPHLCSIGTGDVSGLMVGWVDAVLFARPEVETAKAGDKRVLGVSTGRHLLHTQGTAAFVAGCRYGNVDPVLDLSFAEFRRQVEEGQSIEKMRTKVAALAATVGGETVKRVTDWLARPESQSLQALVRASSSLKREVANNSSEQAVA